MKRFLILLTTLFCTVVYGATFNQYWYNEDNTLYSQTTCSTGGDITLPTPPTKYGYDFIGWEKTYTQIEYLESTGTQWIDTGYRFMGQKDYRVIIKYEYTSAKGGQSIAGAQPNYCFIPYTPSYGGSVSIYHSSLSNSLGTPISANEVYTLEMTQIDDVFTLNINGLTKSATTNTPASIYPYFLFATSNGNRAKEFAIAKIYFVQIYENNILVRNIIPVLDANGTPCMYDKVEDKYYYNAGTGQFIAGPVIGAE